MSMLLTRWFQWCRIAFRPFIFAALLLSISPMIASAKWSDNQEYLATIEEELFLIYQAKEERFTLTIFTDILCPYCRALHSKKDYLLERGVTIRYLPFPLSRSSVPFLEAVWCHESPQEALDLAMEALLYQKRFCHNNLIRRSKEHAKALSVYGTPSLFLESGERIPGESSPEEIVELLEERVKSGF